MAIDTYHVPIMANEVMELLKPERGGIYVDGTLGGGGHSERILSILSKNDNYNKSLLVGIDRDGDAIEEASRKLGQNEFYSEDKSNLKETEDKVKFEAIRGNFFDMKQLLSEKGIYSVDGILLDLGVSSHQLDTPERGFSYHEDAPLDMRMDKRAALSAYDVVNGYSFEQLTRIIREYGEEKFASRIAKHIINEHKKKKINSTVRLADIIKGAIPASTRRDGPHPARRTFQAIRIEVNGELEGLSKAISDAHDLLNKDGVLCVITFHSLEDRIVKQQFKVFENPCICDPHAPICTCGRKPTAQILTRKPIIADEEELELNPRARSAKLRAIRKI